MHKLLLGEFLGQSEVYQFHTGIGGVGVHEAVFRLDVSVADVLAVAVYYSGNELLDNVRRLVLSQMLLLYNPLKQLPALTKLQNNITHTIIFKCFNKLDNIRMI